MTPPIFIIGMIRSGTTLVEQILASHSAVFGAGELHDLSTVADSAVREMGLRFPDGLEDLDDAAFNRLADDYLRRLRVRGGLARHVTDKMPSNFCHVGFIRLILPSARIIHIRRNPLDTCLSVFANYFVHDHPYAYDLTELGAYYRHYEALMEHWRHVLPGAMLELSYEALIEQPEAEIRRLLRLLRTPIRSRLPELSRDEAPRANGECQPSASVPLPQIPRALAQLRSATEAAPISLVWVAPFDAAGTRT